MRTQCPWCYSNISDFIDDELPPEKDCRINYLCPECGKPITIEAECDIMMEYYITKDNSAMLAEMEKYRKRMAGDWK